MPPPEVSLDEARKAEWEALRAEIATRDAQSFQIMTGSITVATGLLTLFFAMAELTGVLHGMLYFIPFCIMLPALYLIVNNVHCVARIAAYIRVALEPGTGLGWERGLAEFYKSPKDVGVKPFEEVDVMYFLFIGLGLLNAVIFALMGDWHWAFGGPLALKVLLLALPFIVFADVYRRIAHEGPLWNLLQKMAHGPADRPRLPRPCARDHYADIWQDVVIGAALASPAATEPTPVATR